jgi:hypothetical protein
MYRAQREREPFSILDFNFIWLDVLILIHFGKRELELLHHG